MHDFAHCNCCGPSGFTRRALLAGSAALAASIATRTAEAAAPPSLDEWLRVRPKIAKAVAWDFGKGLQPYADWPDPFKARLRAAYARAWNNEPSGLADPPPNLSDRKDDEFDVTTLSLEHAFALHAAHVGNGLATEISRRVPWSVADYSEPALQALFGGRHFFVRVPQGPDRYRLMLAGIPAAPELTLAFLRTQKMIGSSRRATVVQMLAWCRDTMVHFTGASITRNMHDHWQYRGAPPVSRVIRGTRFLGPPSSGPAYDPRRHYTAGCWGTTAFLAATLRAVNIPVQQLRATGWSPSRGKAETHSAAYFMADELCLCHSDDPYSAYCRYQPSFDIGEILVPKARFDAWFPADVPPSAERPRSVGRHVADLAIRHLPIYLVQYHAQDVLKSRAPEASAVLENLKRYHPLADLQKMQLWERLDKRLAEFGGAEKTRALYREAVEKHNRANVATSVP